MEVNQRCRSGAAPERREIRATVEDGASWRQRLSERRARPPYAQGNSEKELIASLVYVFFAVNSDAFHSSLIVTWNLVHF